MVPKTVIFIDKGNSIQVDALPTGVITDNDAFYLAIKGLLILAKRMQKQHPTGCTDPNCCLPILGKEIEAALHATMNMHTLTHHKKKPE